MITSIAPVSWRREIDIFSTLCTLKLCAADALIIFALFTLLVSLPWFSSQACSAVALAFVRVVEGAAGGGNCCMYWMGSFFCMKIFAACTDIEHEYLQSSLQNLQICVVEVFVEVVIAAVVVLVELESGCLNLHFFPKVHPD